MKKQSLLLLIFSLMCANALVAMVPEYNPVDYAYEGHIPIIADVDIYGQAPEYDFNEGNAGAAIDDFLVSPGKRKTAELNVAAHHESDEEDEENEVPFIQSVRRQSSSLSPLPYSFKCSVCSKKFEDKEVARRHLKMTHGTEVGTVSCSDCSAFFDTQEALEAHTTAIHKEKCPICFKGFPVQHQLDKHMKIHAYRCPVCTFSSAQEKYLSAHRAHTQH